MRRSTTTAASGIWHSRVYMETDNAHLLCLDARSGHLLWDVAYAEGNKNYGATSAPLVVKDKVIVGTSGGDDGVRGFIAAFERETGKLAWNSGPSLAPASPALRVGRAMLFARRRHHLDARHLRSRTEHAVLGHQQSCARFRWRPTARRRSLHRLRPRARCRHREIQMVFSVHSA